MFVLNRLCRSFLLLLLPLCFVFSTPIYANNSADVLKSFHGSQRGELISSYDEQQFQHEVMFYMGISLLLLVFLTAGLGIAMVMLGKEVFVQHMISAGLTVFLAVAHAVAAIVWFFPFK